MLEKPAPDRTAAAVSAPSVSRRRRLIEFAITMIAGTTLLAGTLYFVDLNAVVEGLRKNGEKGDAQVEASVKARVENLCARFPIYQGL